MAVHRMYVSNNIFLAISRKISHNKCIQFVLRVGGVSHGTKETDTHRD